MNKILIGAFIGVLTATFALDAEAQRRLGGGRNVGKQAPQVQQRQATPPTAAPAQTPQAATAAAPAAGAAGAATAAARSPMKSLLIGAAAGLGLMALASWLGFGETLATIMMFALIGVLILMVIGYFMRRRMGAQAAYQGAGGVTPTLPEQRVEPQPMQRSALDSPGARPGSAMDHFMRGGAVNPASPWGIPAGFDTEGFVANARTYFGKLQAAWQTGNLDDLSDFTTNDMFIALTHELRARGDAPKSIEVQTMETRLLGIESTATEHLASVRFTGAVRVDGEEEKVDEVWNLAKAADGKTGWLLAGIQQIV